MKHSSQYIVSHFQLLLRITRNELSARFAGSVLGVVWAALTPVLLLLIYAAVYLVIFQVRAPNLTSSEYVVMIFSGLVPFLMTSESLVAGVASVATNKAILSNTVFPIDLAPVKIVLMSQVTMVVGMILVLGSLLYLGKLQPYILLLPLVWLLHVITLIGVLWILSLANLILRDLQNLMGVAVMLMMIASPIAYTPEMVPGSMKILLIANPLSYFVVAYQNILVFGQMPPNGTMISIILMAGLSFGIGGLFFTRAKPSLIDYV